jgi:hypothetical protein
VGERKKEKYVTGALKGGKRRTASIKEKFKGNLYNIANDVKGTVSRD